MKFTQAILFTLSLVSLAVKAAPITGLMADQYMHCNRPGVFALTYDDGPIAQTWELAKYLHSEGVVATFFINGLNHVDVTTGSALTSDGERTYMEFIPYLMSLGHEVASHTYSHAGLTTLTDIEVEAELNQLSDIIYNAAEVRPAFMRPPRGEINDQNLAVIRRLGYSVIGWDLDSNDWVAGPLADKQAYYTALMENESPDTLGHISLQHDTVEQTYSELTPWILNYVRSKGLEFVTVSECLSVPAYQ
ncbi:hypothetical protein BDB01DRAFT_786658 [Pilobolus umbonatus]|nr:hypothetical protein BDB01DRAFT_786658 [Pilobolus umbonatus]